MPEIKQRKQPKHIICSVINSVEYDQRMQRICTTLQQNGYEVTLVGRHEKKQHTITPRPYKQVELHCFFNKKVWVYAEYNLRLLWYLLFHKADIICGIDLDTILPCLCVSKIKKIPCVYDAHEYFPGVPEVTNRRGVKHIWMRIEAICFRHVNAVYTVSQSLAELFERRYKKHVDVIRNMPHKQTASTSSQADKLPRSIIYQGALNAGRGLEQMIHTMRYVDATFYIAGEGDLSATLHQLAKKAGLYDTKVKFLGKIKPSDLHTLTLKMMVGINVLESSSLSYYYSLSNKTYDYIQAGIPQVAIRFPEMERLNNEYGVMYLVDDLKVDTLQHALNTLLNDTLYYEKLHNTCVKASTVLTWKNEEAALLTIYKSLS